MPGGHVRVLYVCTANICRSVSAQWLLRDAISASPELADIEVFSAGTAPRPGSPGCTVAPALAGRSSEHRSQALTVDLIAQADLILCAAREHRAPVVGLTPKARTRTFTIRQAGRIADWLVDTGMVTAARERARSTNPDTQPERYEPGDPRRDVQPLPDDPTQRWTWLVSEMNEARGLAGSPTASAPDDAHLDDIPDPHMLDMALHALAYEQLKDSTDALGRGQNRRWLALRLALGSALTVLPGIVPSGDERGEL